MVSQTSRALAHHLLRDCEDCNGEGHVRGAQCHKCYGSGKSVASEPTIRQFTGDGHLAGRFYISVKICEEEYRYLHTDGIWRRSAMEGDEPSGYYLERRSAHIVLEKWRAFA